MAILYVVIISPVFFGVIMSLKKDKGDLSKAITDHLKSNGYVHVKSIKKLRLLEYSRCPYASKLVRPAVRVGAMFISKNDIIIRKVIVLNTKEKLEELWVLIEDENFTGERNFKYQKTGRFK